MTTQPDGVNPLRPYYIPPTIGDSAATTNGPSSIVSGGGAGRHHATNSSRFASSRARNVLGDLDYDKYLSGDDAPSVVQNAKDLFDELLWKYTSVLIAQPFEAAKIILQIRDQDSPRGGALSPGDGPQTPKTPARSMSYNSSIYDVSRLSVYPRLFMVVF